MIKLLLILSILIITTLANENKKITLQLNWLHQFQFAGYYMAKEKGFYKNLDLDLNIKEFTFDTNLIESIKNEKAQFAVGRSSLLIEKTKGEDIIALGAIFQESPLVLLVTKDSNINKVEDLRNKKIMMTPDVRFSASILAMLSSKGISQSDFIMQKHSFNLDDLINKKTDAMSSYLSNEPIRLGEKDIEYKIFDPKDYGFNFYSDILFTSSIFIKKHPKLTKDFYDASIKGWEYAFDNITETAELIYEKYNTQNKSLIQLVKEGEVLKKLAYANTEGLGYIDDRKLSDIINTFKILGLVTHDIDADDFIYDENPHKNIRFEITQNEEKFIIISMVFLLIIFLIITYLFNKHRETKELLHTIINATDDLIFFKDHKSKYIGCNKSFERIIRKEESYLIGKDDSSFFKKELSKRFRQEDLDVIDNKKTIIKNEWFTIKDKKFLFQTKMIPFTYKKGKRDGILSISRDITDLYEIQEKLKIQAYRDELTKAYNRNAFNERLEEKLDLYHRYETIFAMCMFDIDDFKYINDTYGHDSGDKVLRKISDKIRQTIRKSDLFFRVGGEEFIIVFPKTSKEEAYLVVEKIRYVISKMNIIENEYITISLGLSEIQKNDTLDIIYERVDKLMYQSKKNGKNQTTKD